MFYHTSSSPYYYEYALRYDTYTKQYTVMYRRFFTETKTPTWLGNFLGFKPKKNKIFYGTADWRYQDRFRSWSSEKDAQQNIDALIKLQQDLDKHKNSEIRITPYRDTSFNGEAGTS